MRVAVTGGSGGLGLATAQMAQRAGHRVRAFVRSTRRFTALCSDERIEVVEGDLLDRQAVAAAFDRADAVVHCASLPPREGRRNWDLLTHVMEALPEGARLVYPGNVWGFGRAGQEPVGPESPKEPASALGALKAEMEKAVLGLAGTVVHFPDFYGPGVRTPWVRAIFTRALAGRTVWFPGDLDRPHAFIYIDDAARAMVAALEPAVARGRAYTAPAYRPVAPREMIRLAFRASGQRGQARSIPLPLLRALAPLHPDLRRLRGLFYLFEEPVRLDGRRIREELGWIPEVDPADGVRRTIRWLRRRQEDADGARASVEAHVDEG